jgi:hypothetical protein
MEEASIVQHIRDIVAAPPLENGKPLTKRKIRELLALRVPCNVEDLKQDPWKQLFQKTLDDLNMVITTSEQQQQQPQDQQQPEQTAVDEQPAAAAAPQACENSENATTTTEQAVEESTAPTATSSSSSSAEQQQEEQQGADAKPHKKHKKHKHKHHKHKHKHKRRKTRSPARSSKQPAKKKKKKTLKLPPCPRLDKLKQLAKTWGIKFTNAIRDKETNDEAIDVIEQLLQSKGVEATTSKKNLQHAQLAAEVAELGPIDLSLPAKRSTRRDVAKQNGNGNKKQATKAVVGKRRASRSSDDDDEEDEEEEEEENDSESEDDDGDADPMDILRQLALKHAVV